MALVVTHQLTPIFVLVWVFAFAFATGGFRSGYRFDELSCRGFGFSKRCPGSWTTSISSLPGPGQLGSACGRWRRAGRAGFVESAQLAVIGVPRRGRGHRRMASGEGRPLGAGPVCAPAAPGVVDDGRRNATAARGRCARSFALPFVAFLVVASACSPARQPGTPPVRLVAGLVAAAARSRFSASAGTGCPRPTSDGGIGSIASFPVIRRVCIRRRCRCARSRPGPPASRMRRSQAVARRAVPRTPLGSANRARFESDLRDLAYGGYVILTPGQRDHLALLRHAARRIPRRSRARPFGGRATYLVHRVRPRACYLGPLTGLLVTRTQSTSS